MWVLAKMAPLLVHTLLVFWYSICSYKDTHPPFHTHTYLHKHKHTFLLLVVPQTTKWRNEDQVRCRQFLRSRVGCNYHRCETLVGCSYVITTAGVKPHHIRPRGRDVMTYRLFPKEATHCLHRLNDTIPLMGNCFVFFPSARRIGKYYSSLCILLENIWQLDTVVIWLTSVLFRDLGLLRPVRWNGLIFYHGHVINTFSS